MRLVALAVLVLVTGAGCGSTPDTNAKAVPDDRRAEAPADAVDGCIVVSRPETLPDLLDEFNDQFDVSILHDPTSRVREVSVEFVGDFRIPRDRAREWLEAVLAYHGMTLDEGRDQDGESHWFVNAGP